MEERFVIDPDAVEWREVEGEVVALDVARSEYLAINESGAVLWRELEGGATRPQLVERLVNEFGLDERRAVQDVDSFLSSLADRGLLST